MQSKEELEQWYSEDDPWGYETHADDAVRKNKIISVCHGDFDTALDIGCGEGFVTRDLPAKQIFGYEISDKAASRFPENVTRITDIDGKYDLVVATGVLYAQYDWESITKSIQECAKMVIVTCNIKDWEINTLPQEWLVHCEEFPYREYTQRLCRYEVPTT